VCNAHIVESNIEKGSQRQLSKTIHSDVVFQTVSGWTAGMITLPSHGIYDGKDRPSYGRRAIPRSLDLQLSMQLPFQYCSF
jgi:hypothetical protein